MKKIFISKNIEDLSYLKAFCESNGIDLHASSLIRFNQVLFTLNVEYDVIFFSSIRSASFFMKHKKIPKHVQIACIGEVTSRKLIEKGLELSFVGQKSGNPNEVAREFLNWLGKKKVLIPTSNLSMGTISRQIPIDQKIEIEVYQTLFECKPVETCDYYIFTSPSNLDSFLRCNPTPEGKIIAWGNTTKRALLGYDLFPFITLENANEEELIAHLSLV